MHKGLCRVVDCQKFPMINQYYPDYSLEVENIGRSKRTCSISDAKSSNKIHYNKRIK